MFEGGTIDFAVYEEATEFVGIASVKLPDKQQKVIVMNGAGIGGDVEIPVPGHYDSMEMELTFRNYSPRIAMLREPRRHNIELRVAQQGEDPVAGALVTEAVKHVFVVVPKGASGGTVAPASPGDMSVKFSVRYWATYYDGKKLDEVDPLNRVDVVNGFDANTPVRKALGK